MCGIVGLHLRDDELSGQLGTLLSGMLLQVGERGPDSAGVGIYGDPVLSPPNLSTVSVLSDLPPDTVGQVVGGSSTPPGLTVAAAGPVRLVSASLAPAELEAAVRAGFGSAGQPCAVIGRGRGVAVLKGVGGAGALSAEFDLPSRVGVQAIGHTRMATESAVTLAHGHPFCVRDDLCLVHNGSFANHDTIRRQLAAEGVFCDTDNDSEVGARFLGWRLDCGDDLDKALRLLGETFEGFFTLLVTTATEMAVVRDAVACKPAVVAETAQWVAMASEYRALAGLPGIESARVYEPEPEEVYLWARS